MDRTEQARDADGDYLVVLAQSLPAGPKPIRIMRECDLALVLRGYPDRNVELAVYPLERALVLVPIRDSAVSEKTAADVEREVADRDRSPE